MSTTPATATPSGNGTAVVTRAWPGGMLSHQGPAPDRVQLGEHVVEKQDRGYPEALGGTSPVHPEAQGEGEAALLALGGLDPRVLAPPNGAGSRSSRCGPTVVAPRRRSSERDDARASASEPSQVDR